MTKTELQMSKESQMTRMQMTNGSTGAHAASNSHTVAKSSVDIRHSDFFRHLILDIRHSP